MEPVSLPEDEGDGEADMDGEGQDNSPLFFWPGYNGIHVHSFYLRHGLTGCPFHWDTPMYRETSGVGRRKLMTMDEVLRMDVDRALVILRGKKEAGEILEHAGHGDIPGADDGYFAGQVGDDPAGAQLLPQHMDGDGQRGGLPPFIHDQRKGTG